MPLTTPLSSTTLSTDPHTYLHTELYARRQDYLTPTNIRIKIGTWNVASLAVERDIREWIRECEDNEEGSLALGSTRCRSKGAGSQELLDGAGEKEREVGIYVLALQEIVDVTAPENYLRPTDPKIPLSWKAHVQASLPAGYTLVASPQLIGILTLVCVSPRIQHLISSVSTSTVGTGLMGYVGNKGATGVRLVLGETTRLVLINCHLAAFQNGTDRRNWDHGEILRRMTFEQVKRGVLAGFPLDGKLNSPVTGERESMDKADLVIWCGDLNYRIDLPNDEIRNALEPFVPPEFPPTIPSEYPKSPARYTSPRPPNFPRPPTLQPTQELLDEVVRSLLAHDQLYKQQHLQKSFTGYKEGTIAFLPTYKYDIGTTGVFDSSEKKRAPSYCDRILWQMKDEDLTQEGEGKEAPISNGQPKSSFETINTFLSLERQDKKEERNIESPPKIVMPNRRRATTLTVEDEDGGEDLIVSRSDNIIPHLAPPQEEEETAEDPPASFLQNATSSSSLVSGLKLGLVVYTSHQAVRSSDHKPVTALFSLTFPAVNDERKSNVYAEVAKEVDRIENERRPVVTVNIDRAGEQPSPVQSDYRNEEMNVSLGEVRLGERIEKKLTIANTGLVPAKCLFRKRPIIDDELGEERESICKDWLDVDFDDDHSDNGKAINQGVKLEPGEVVNVYISLLIEMSDTGLLQRLNKKDERLEDILVLHVEDGRDLFIPVSGQWMQSCFGRSLQELVMIPEGAGGARVWFSRDKQQTEAKVETGYSAPRELYRITAYLLHQTKKIVEEDTAKEDGIENQKWYSDVGWPFVKETWGLQYDEDDVTAEEDTPGKRRSLLVMMLECLSQDMEFEIDKWVEENGYTAEDITEVAAECLLGFLGSLDGRVVPESLYETVMKAGGGGATKEAEKVIRQVPIYQPYYIIFTNMQVLESLPSSASPIHANVFVYLTGFISEMFAILSTPNLDSLPLTRSATTDTVSSAASKVGNKPSATKVNARQALLKQRLAGIFAEVMMDKPPPLVPDKSKSTGGVAGGWREKKGDEERRRAVLVHFLRM